MLKVQVKDGLKIKLMIAQTGKSFRAFAKEAGISHTYLSQIVNGKSQPSATIAYKIANALKIELEDIFFV